MKQITLNNNHNNIIKYIIIMLNNHGGKNAFIIYTSIAVFVDGFVALIYNIMVIDCSRPKQGVNYS